MDDVIVPFNFVSVRVFWSMRRKGERCVYLCMTNYSEANLEEEGKREREGEWEGEERRKEVLFTVISGEGEEGEMMQCAGIQHKREQ